MSLGVFLLIFAVLLVIGLPMAVIFGTIYGGIVSPTEAAVISVVYALIICLFVYRTIRLRDLPKVFMAGADTYVNILFIIAAAVLANVHGKIPVLLVITVIMLVCGMVTPPMGINLYVASGMTKIPVMKLAKACVPFLIAFLIALLLVTFVPELSTFLPSLAAK